MWKIAEGPSVIQNAFQADEEQSKSHHCGKAISSAVISGCQEVILSEVLNLQTFIASIQFLSLILIVGNTYFMEYSLLPVGNNLIILTVVLLYSSNISKRKYSAYETLWMRYNVDCLLFT